MSWMSKSAWTAAAVTALVLGLVVLGVSTGRRAREGLTVSGNDGVLSFDAWGRPILLTRPPTMVVPNAGQSCSASSDPAACCRNRVAYGDYSDPLCNWPAGMYPPRRRYWVPPPSSTAWSGGGVVMPGDEYPYFPRYGYYAGVRCVDLGNAGYRPCCATKRARGAYDDSCPTPQPGF